MEAYYAQRAREYERIYAKPERQADLARMRIDIPALFEGETVLEIACGTGYWTPLIAARAKSILGVDQAEETLEIARGKSYPKGNARFEQADAYRLPDWAQNFSASYAGFWWSHVPLEKIDAFLQQLHARLAPGARVALMDNLFVEGNSTPLSRRDAAGNTYQERSLSDGSRHEVLKNYPAAGELEARLGRIGTEVRVIRYQYYWLASYRIMAERRSP